VTSSTISNNLPVGGAGAVFNTGILTVTDSTISGNLTGRGDGGGTANVGNLTLTNSTLSDNTAGLGDTVLNEETTTIEATILNVEERRNDFQ